MKTSKNRLRSEWMLTPQPVFCIYGNFGVIK